MAYFVGAALFYFFDELPSESQQIGDTVNGLDQGSNHNQKNWQKTYECQLINRERKDIFLVQVEKKER